VEPPAVVPDVVHVDRERLGELIGVPVALMISRSAYTSFTGDAETAQEARDDRDLGLARREPIGELADREEAVIAREPGLLAQRDEGLQRLGVLDLEHQRHRDGIAAGVGPRSVADGNVGAAVTGEAAYSVAAATASDDSNNDRVTRGEIFDFDMQLPPLRGATTTEPRQVRVRIAITAVVMMRRANLPGPGSPTSVRHRPGKMPPSDVFCCRSGTARREVAMAEAGRSGS